MKIVRLDIEGFRGVHRGKVLFNDFTILIGANNCGKTTVVEALALLLGRDRLVRTLTEHDFFGSDPQAATRIKIIATISGFAHDDPAHHHEWFRQGRGVEKWFDPTSGDLHPAITAQATQLACQIAFCARFDRTTLETETSRYFYDDVQDDDPFSDDSPVVPFPISLVKELGIFLVPANRTWDRMMSFGSDLFRKTVAYVGGNPAEAVLVERDRLRDPEQPLEEDEKLSALVEDVNEDLETLFGRQIDLSLRLTSTDSEGVLDAVMPHFQEAGRPSLPGRRHGNGIISLQTLVLLMRFGSLRKARGDNFIMLIEEPELHVPPPQQRKLLHYLRRMATQTIITSHSPTVSAVAAPHQLVLMVNRTGTLSANPLLTAPIDQNATAVRRSLFLTERAATVSAVMHPCVLIPEGKFDASWLRLFGRIADLTELPDDAQSATFTHEVGVIPTKDARINETYRDLAVVHPALSCLVDGDQSGNDYKNALSAGVSPCPRIIQWPNGWEIEDVVAWVCAGDASIIAHADLAPFNLPANIAALANHLKSPAAKTDEILHGTLADLIVAKPLCGRRVRHVLSVLAAIAIGRAPPAGSAVQAAHANGVTHHWTFNDAFPGI
ncbi:AAA family ATPase [Mesorhizobium sp. WSM3868]|uniref:ATP-dependent nuclease n=1 Tax=Mesorhizobium sp. WSM3868 TaxID=2029405 RepID=UPI000BAEF8E1|nr:AAA family ATPase [Mesorhizobium sp. WSM3868]PBB39619.1 chromosome partitioning protein [Mesorhizobium sp. WSM3868]